MNVSIVEDEAGIREAVAYALREEGYDVAAFADGEAALNAWGRAPPDLAILDIILPHVGGIELCRRIRRMSDSSGIIFLTSKSDEIDRVLGLELGADDYLCKPFSMRELIARVHSVERRISTQDIPRDRLQIPAVGGLELDPGAFSCHWHGAPVRLTVTEFRILQALSEDPGVVIDRDTLLARAYPDDVYVTDRSIDSHIRRIRRKFQVPDPAFKAIESVYGAGYRILPDDL